MVRILARALLIFALLDIAHAGALDMNMGFKKLKQVDGGHTSIFYPTGASEVSVKEGPFNLSLATTDAPPTQGNGRLIVISHGSGGSPWVHTDLARALVKRGFTVAMPQHHGDNYLDDANPGPASWVLRPIEVSRAIDTIAGDTELSAILSLDAVGVFGGSAGGHTALSLAGGAWSPSRFRDHCKQNIANDFSSCVGFKTLLNDNWLDGIKIWLAKLIISWRFSDETLQRHFDPRVKAAIAMVPFAADFATESLIEPKIALGLIIAEKDINQVPSFHVEAVRKACEPRCEVVMRLTEGGHGAMLSPLPPLQTGSIASHLLSDPKSFDRSAALTRLNELIADFFSQKLFQKQ